MATKSKAFDRSGRITGKALTKEANDWAENNAQKESRIQKQIKQINPIKRKQLEKESPITSHNKHTPSYFHSSENELRLNTDNMEEYNVAKNLLVSKQQFAKYFANQQKKNSRKPMDLTQLKRKR